MLWQKVLFLCNMLEEATLHSSWGAALLGKGRASTPHTKLQRTLVL